MIPIGALVGAAVGASRRGRNAGGPKPEPGNTILGLARVFAVIPVFMSFAVNPGLGLALSLLYVLSWFPSIVLTSLFVPLGMSRGAYFFTRIFTPFGHGRTPRASGVMYGMLAVLHAREIDLARVEWLQNKLVPTSRWIEPVRGPTLAAHGLIAFVRKDNARARDIFEILAPIGPTSTPWLARRIAYDWLMADALQRGDWPTAARIGVNAQMPFRWLIATRWMARRILGEVEAPSDLAIQAAWLWAPHRAATLPLLRRALAVPRVRRLDRAHAHVDATSSARQVSPSVDASSSARATATTTPAATALPAKTTIDAALAAHATSLTREPGATLANAAVAWDAVRNDPTTQAFFQRRALALGTQLGPDTALMRMLTEAEADLTALCTATGPGPAVPSLTYFTVTERVRSEQLREVEYLSGAMKKRTIDQRDLEPIDEWLEWSHLHTAAERVLAGSDAATKRAIFEVVYLPVCNHAVRLFNIRKQGLLAHVMFRWLLLMTKKNENPTAYKLLQKNANASFVDY